MNIFEPLTSLLHRIYARPSPIACDSRSRVEFSAHIGDVLNITEAALAKIGREMECQTIPSGSRYVTKSDPRVSVEVRKEGGDRVTVEICSEGEEDLAAAAASAAQRASSRIGRIRRQKSYHSEAHWPTESLFGPLMEMEGLLGEIFGDWGDERTDWGQSAYSSEGGKLGGNSSPPLSSSSTRELESMGVQVILPKKDLARPFDWSLLAGCEEIKAQIEEAVVVGLQHPELLGKIASQTRQAESCQNRPRLVLFEGPPGTGKSSSARIIAAESNVPLIHVPLEAIVSKWFGDSEKQVARVFALAREIAKSQNAPSVLLFIDEVDSLVSSRDMGSPHEASKRILSVLLRQIDGFDQHEIPATLICATNRRKDLDSAFLSRVDSSIHFPLPSRDSRKKILRLYAKHLAEEHIESLAMLTEGFSGRSLRDLCQSAERHWAAAMVRQGNVENLKGDIPPPPPSEYTRLASNTY